MGRKKGTKNRITCEQQDKADDLGIDPFTIMLLFAAGDWEKLGYPERKEKKFTRQGEAYYVDVITAEVRLKAASDCCQYLLPKRKSIMITQAPPPESETRPLKDLTDEELMIYNV